MEGTPVKIGGREFIVPRHTNGTRLRLLRLFASSDAKGELAALESMAEILMLAIRPGPDVSKEDLLDLIYPEESQRVVREVLRAGGWELPEGEAKSP